jgi:cytochrome c-type biogenesis protein CcmH/NrfG
MDRRDVGQVRCDGAGRPVSSALHALLLLAIFFTLIRPIGRWLRPAEHVLDCDQTAPRDAAGLERCTVLRPGDVELLVELGSVYESAAQWERAGSVYRRALSIDPEDGDVHVRLARVLLRTGDAAGAHREGATALSFQPGNAAALDIIRLATVAGGGQ